MMWAQGKAHDEVCSSIDVEVLNAEKTTFVTPDGIKKEIARLGFKPVGQPVDHINTDAIESKLKKSEYLESVDCAVAANGHLVVRVKQIVPLMRVFDSNCDTPYYLNRYGKRMMATSHFHADVPIVQGAFTSKFPASRLLPLIEYAQGDSLLNSLITMVSVRDSNNIFIVPAIYGHVVNLGDLSNLNNKFDKLRAFYRCVLPSKGYEYYDTISVKWSYQIAATRKGWKPKEKIVMDSTDMTDETDLADIQGLNMAPAKPQPAAQPKPKAAAQPKAATQPKAAQPKATAQPKANPAPAQQPKKNI